MGDKDLVRISIMNYESEESSGAQMERRGDSSVSVCCAQDQPTCLFQVMWLFVRLCLLEQGQQR